ncbi:prolyl oligopeptidase family serine peptidase [Nocardia sp. NPDC004750]
MDRPEDLSEARMAEGDQILRDMVDDAIARILGGEGPGQSLDGGGGIAPRSTPDYPSGGSSPSSSRGGGTGWSGWNMTETTRGGVAVATHPEGGSATPMPTRQAQISDPQLRPEQRGITVTAEGSATRPGTPEPGTEVLLDDGSSAFAIEHGPAGEMYLVAPEQTAGHASQDMVAPRPVGGTLDEGATTHEGQPLHKVDFDAEIAKLEAELAQTSLPASADTTAPSVEAPIQAADTTPPPSTHAGTEDAVAGHAQSLPDATPPTLVDSGTQNPGQASAPAPNTATAGYASATPEPRNPVPPSTASPAAGAPVASNTSHTGEPRPPVGPTTSSGTHSSGGTSPLTAPLAGHTPNANNPTAHTNAPTASAPAAGFPSKDLGNPVARTNSPTASTPPPGFLPTHAGETPHSAAPPAAATGRPGDDEPDADPEEFPTPPGTVVDDPREHNIQKDPREHSVQQDPREHSVQKKPAGDHVVIPGVTYPLEDEPPADAIPVIPRTPSLTPLPNDSVGLGRLAQNPDDPDNTPGPTSPRAPDITNPLSDRHTAAPETNLDAGLGKTPDSLSMPSQYATEPSPDVPGAPQKPAAPQLNPHSLEYNDDPSRLPSIGGVPHLQPAPPPKKTEHKRLVTRMGADPDEPKRRKRTRKQQPPLPPPEPPQPTPEPPAPVPKPTPQPKPKPRSQPSAPLAHEEFVVREVGEAIGEIGDEGPRVAAAKDARRWVTSLPEKLPWLTADQIETAKLLISEMVANALRWTEGKVAVAATATDTDDTRKTRFTVTDDSKSTWFELHGPRGSSAPTRAGHQPATRSQASAPNSEQRNTIEHASESPDTQAPSPAANESGAEKTASDKSGTSEEPENTEEGKKSEKLLHLVRNDSKLGIRLGAEFLNSAGFEIMQAMTGLYLMEEAGPGVAGAVVWVVQVPYIGGALLAGHMSDHYSAKKLVWVGNGLAAVSTFTAAGALRAGTSHSVPILVGATIAEAIGTVISSSAASRAFQEMVGNAKGALTQFNNFKMNATRVLGKGLGPMVASVPWLAPLIDASTNIVNIASSAGMPEIATAKKQAVGESISEGVRAIQDHPLRRRINNNNALTNLYLGLQGIDFTWLVAHYGLTDFQQGAALLITPLGGVIGSAIPRKWLARFSVDMLLTARAMGVAVTAIVEATAPNIWVASAGFAGTWAVLGVGGIPVRTYLTKTIPSEIRGRTDAFQLITTRSALAVGGGVAGLSLGLVGHEPTALGIATAFGSLAGWSLQRLFKARKLLDCINQTSRATWALGLDTGIKPKWWQKSPEHLQRAIATQLVDIEFDPDTDDPVTKTIDDVRNLEVRNLEGRAADTAVLLLAAGKKMHSLTITNTDNKPGGNIVIFDTNITNPDDPHTDPNDPERIPRVRTLDKWKETHPDITEAFVAFLTTDEEDNLTNLHPHDPDQRTPRKDGKVSGRLGSPGDSGASPGRDEASVSDTRHASTPVANNEDFTAPAGSGHATAEIQAAAQRQSADPPAEEPVSKRKLLVVNKPFANLLLGRLRTPGGEFGNRIGTVTATYALPYVVMDATNSPMAAGVAGAAVWAPKIAELHAGPSADRHNRQKMMFYAQSVGAAAAATATGLVLFKVPDLGLALTGTTLIESTAATYYFRAYQAGKRDFLTDAQRKSGNRLTNMLDSTADIIGQSLGPNLAGIAPAAPFGLNALSYFMNLANMRGLTFPAQVLTEPRGLFQDIGKGARALWRNRFLRESTVLSTINNAAFTMMALRTAILLNDADLPGWGTKGAVVAAPAVGGMLSGFLPKVFDNAEPSTLYSVALANMAVFSMLQASTDNPAVIGAAGFLDTMLMMAMNSRFATYQQEAFPTELQGRAGSVRGLFLGLGPAIGFLVGGSVAGANGETAAALAATITAISATGYGVLLLVRKGRVFLRILTRGRGWFGQPLAEAATSPAQARKPVGASSTKAATPGAVTAGPTRTPDPTVIRNCAIQLARVYRALALINDDTPEPDDTNRQWDSKKNWKPIEFHLRTQLRPTEHDGDPRFTATAETVRDAANTGIHMAVRIVEDNNKKTHAYTFVNAGDQVLVFDTLIESPEPDPDNPDPTEYIPHVRNYDGDENGRNKWQPKYQTIKKVFAADYIYENGTLTPIQQPIPRYRHTTHPHKIEGPPSEQTPNPEDPHEAAAPAPRSKPTPSDPADQPGFVQPMSDNVPSHQAIANSIGREARDIADEPEEPAGNSQPESDETTSPNDPSDSPQSVPSTAVASAPQDESAPAEYEVAPPLVSEFYRPEAVRGAGIWKPTVRDGLFYGPNGLYNTNGHEYFLIGVAPEDIRSVNYSEVFDAMRRVGTPHGVLYSTYDNPDDGPIAFGYWKIRDGVLKELNFTSGTFLDGPKDLAKQLKFGAQLRKWLRAHDIDPSAVEVVNGTLQGKVWRPWVDGPVPPVADLIDEAGGRAWTVFGSSGDGYWVGVDNVESSADQLSITLTLNLLDGETGKFTWILTRTNDSYSAKVSNMGWSPSATELTAAFDDLHTNLTTPWLAEAGVHVSSSEARTSAVEHSDGPAAQPRPSTPRDGQSDTAPAPHDTAVSKSTPWAGRTARKEFSENASDQQTNPSEPGSSAAVRSTPWNAATPTALPAEPRTTAAPEEPVPNPAESAASVTGAIAPATAVSRTTPWNRATQAEPAGDSAAPPPPGGGELPRNFTDTPSVEVDGKIVFQTFSAENAERLKRSTISGLVTEVAQETESTPTTVIDETGASRTTASLVLHAVEAPDISHPALASKVGGFAPVTITSGDLTAQVMILYRIHESGSADAMIIYVSSVQDNDNFDTVRRLIDSALMQRLPGTTIAITELHQDGAGEPIERELHYDPPRPDAIQLVAESREARPASAPPEQNTEDQADAASTPDEPARTAGIDLSVPAGHTGVSEAANDASEAIVDRMPAEEGPAPRNATYADLRAWAAALSDEDANRLLPLLHAEAVEHLDALERGTPRPASEVVATGRALTVLIWEQSHRLSAAMPASEIHDYATLFAASRQLADQLPTAQELYAAANTVFTMAGALTLDVPGTADARRSTAIQDFEFMHSLPEQLGRSVDEIELSFGSVPWSEESSLSPQAAADPGHLERTAAAIEQVQGLQLQFEAIGATSGSDWAEFVDKYLTSRSEIGFDPELARAMPLLSAEDEAFTRARTGSERDFATAAAPYLADLTAVATHYLSRSRDIGITFDLLHQARRAFTATAERLPHHLPAHHAAQTMALLLGTITAAFPELPGHELPKMMRSHAQVWLAERTGFYRSLEQTLQELRRLGGPNATVSLPELLVGDSTPHRMMSAAEFAEQLAEAERSGPPVRTAPPHMFTQNSVTELLIYPNGFVTVEKTGLTRISRAAEILASAVGHAMEAPVPPVLPVDGDDSAIRMPWLPGITVRATPDDPGALSAMEALLDHPDADQLGLLDLAINNWDRQNNWMRDGNRLYGYDHAFAFRRPVDPDSSPFSRPYVSDVVAANEEDPYRWASNNRSPSQLDQYLRNVHALLPLFVNYEFPDWHSGVVTRLRSARHHAGGSTAPPTGSDGEFPTNRNPIPDDRRRSLPEGPRKRAKPINDIGILPREVEVLNLTLEGLSRNEIAARLGLTPETVTNYRTTAAKKLGTVGVINTVVEAKRWGFLTETRTEESTLIDVSEEDRELLQLLAEGKTYQQIAHKWRASPESVERRAVRIGAELGVSEQVPMAMKALRLGLITVDSGVVVDEATGRSASHGAENGVIAGAPAPLIQHVLPADVHGVQISDSERSPALTVRLTAEQALRDLGLQNEPIPLAPNGEPRWPASLVGDTTGTDRYAAAAFAPAQDYLAVGLDAKDHVPVSRSAIPGLAQHQERLHLRDLASAYPGIYWTQVLASVKDNAIDVQFRLDGTELHHNEMEVTLSPDPSRPNSGSFEIHPATKERSAATPALFSGNFDVDGGTVLTAITVRHGSGDPSPGPKIADEQALPAATPVMQKDDPGRIEPEPEKQSTRTSPRVRELTPDRDEAGRTKPDPEPTTAAGGEPFGHAVRDATAPESMAMPTQPSEAQPTTATSSASAHTVDKQSTTDTSAARGPSTEADEASTATGQPPAQNRAEAPTTPGTPARRPPPVTLSDRETEISGSSPAVERAATVGDRRQSAEPTIDPARQSGMHLGNPEAMADDATGFGLDTPVRKARDVGTVPPQRGQKFDPGPVHAIGRHPEGRAVGGRGPRPEPPSAPATPEVSRPNDQDDPHLWLEEVHGERQLAWAHEHTQRTVDEFTSTQEFDDLLEQILEVLNNTDRVLTVRNNTWNMDRIENPARFGDWLFDFRHDADHPKGYLRRIRFADYRNGDQQNWETLLDFGALAVASDQEWTQGKWVFGQVKVLQDGQHRALISMSEGGGDFTVVREFDLHTKRFIEPAAGGFELPSANNRFEWVDIDTLHVGTDFGPGSFTEGRYTRVIKRWRRGTPLDEAEILVEAEADDVIARVGDDIPPGTEPRQVRRYTEFYDHETYAVARDGSKALLDVPANAKVTWSNNRMLVQLADSWTVGDREYPGGSLLVTALDGFLAGNRDFDVLFTSDAHNVLYDHAWTKNHLVVTRLSDVRTKIDIFTPTAEGWIRRPLEGLPENATARFMGSDPVAGDDDFLVATTGYTAPAGVYAGSVDGGLHMVESEPEFFDATDVVTEQFVATSADGTEIPYDVTYRRGATGPRATIATAYGGFGRTRLPAYDGVLGRSWLEDGGVFVEGHIRGGGAYPGWQAAARGILRYKGHEDMAAIATDLIARGITTPELLGAIGDSNGGLLMGAMYAKYPHLFGGGIVADIPLLDMKRFHLLGQGAIWKGEYGDPDNPEEAPHIFSPYHEVEAGRRRPPILLRTSSHDDRVHPGHARKMAALLEALGYEVWYYESTDGGHNNIGDNRQAAFERALVYAFFRQKLMPGHPADQPDAEPPSTAGARKPGSGSLRAGTLGDRSLHDAAHSPADAPTRSAELVVRAENGELHEADTAVAAAERAAAWLAAEFNTWPPREVRVARSTLMSMVTDALAQRKGEVHIVAEETADTLRVTLLDTTRDHVAPMPGPIAAEGDSPLVRSGVDLFDRSTPRWRQAVWFEIRNPLPQPGTGLSTGALTDGRQSSASDQEPIVGGSWARGSRHEPLDPTLVLDLPAQRASGMDGLGFGPPPTVVNRFGDAPPGLPAGVVAHAAIAGDPNGGAFGDGRSEAERIARAALSTFRVEATFDDLRDWAARLSDDNLRHLLAMFTHKITERIAAIHRGDPAPVTDHVIDPARLLGAIVTEATFRFSDNVPATTPTTYRELFAIAPWLQANRRTVADLHSAMTAVLDAAYAVTRTSTAHRWSVAAAHHTVPAHFAEIALHIEEAGQHNIWLEQNLFETGAALDAEHMGLARSFLRDDVRDRTVARMVREWAYVMDALLQPRSSKTFSPRYEAIFQSLPVHATALDRARTGSDRLFAATIATALPDLLDAAFYLLPTSHSASGLGYLRQADALLADAATRFTDNFAIYALQDAADSVHRLYEDIVVAHSHRSHEVRARQMHDILSGYFSNELDSALNRSFRWGVRALWGLGSQRPGIDYAREWHSLDADLPWDWDTTDDERALAATALDLLQNMHGPEADIQSLLRHSDSPDLVESIFDSVGKNMRWWYRLGRWTSGHVPIGTLLAGAADFSVNQIQLAVLRQYPHIIGAAGGIEYRARDLANRLSLARDLASPRLTPQQRDELAVLRDQLAEVRRGAHGLAIPGSSAPPVLLVSYDPVVRGGTGRAVVSIGEADSASFMAFNVTGADTPFTDLSEWSIAACQQYNEARQHAPDSHLAIMFTAGRVHAPSRPAGPDAMPMDNVVEARDFAGKLAARELITYDATRELALDGSDESWSRILRRSTAIGHGDGIGVLRSAADTLRLDRAVDQIVLVPDSAGDRLPTATQLNIGAEDVYTLNPHRDRNGDPKTIGLIVVGHGGDIESAPEASNLSTAPLIDTPTTVREVSQLLFAHEYRPLDGRRGITMTHDEGLTVYRAAQPLLHDALKGTYNTTVVLEELGLVLRIGQPGTDSYDPRFGPEHSTLLVISQYVRNAPQLLKILTGRMPDGRVIDESAPVLIERLARGNNLAETFRRADRRTIRSHQGLILRTFASIHEQLRAMPENHPLLYRLTPPGVGKDDTGGWYLNHIDWYKENLYRRHYERFGDLFDEFGLLRGDPFAPLIDEARSMRESRHHILHADPNAGNFLISNELRVTLLDWELAVTGPSAYDWARLGHLIPGIEVPRELGGPDMVKFARVEKFKRVMNDTVKLAPLAAAGQLTPQLIEFIETEFSEAVIQVRQLSGHTDLLPPRAELEILRSWRP